MPCLEEGKGKKTHTQKRDKYFIKKITLPRPKAPRPINLDSTTHKFSPYLKEKEEGKRKKKARTERTTASSGFTNAAVPPNTYRSAIVVFPDPTSGRPAASTLSAEYTLTDRLRYHRGTVTLADTGGVTPTLATTPGAALCSLIRRP